MSCLISGGAVPAEMAGVCCWILAVITGLGSVGHGKVVCASRCGLGPRRQSEVTPPQMLVRMGGGLYPLETTSHAYPPPIPPKPPPPSPQYPSPSCTNTAKCYEVCFHLDRASRSTDQPGRSAMTTGREVGGGGWRVGGGGQSEPHSSPSVPGHSLREGESV